MRGADNLFQVFAAGRIVAGIGAHIGIGRAVTVDGLLDARIHALDFRRHLGFVTRVFRAVDIAVVIDVQGVEKRHAVGDEFVVADLGVVIGVGLIEPGGDRVRLAGGGTEGLTRRRKEDVLAHADADIVLRQKGAGRDPRGQRQDGKDG